MRSLLLAVAIALPFSAFADDETPARVSVVQKRQYTLRHEISVSGGFLPLDAFYKGVTVNLAYTFHFNDHFAWRVARGTYDKAFDTGLKKQLENQFGVLTTDFPEVQWMAGSDLIWNAFYGKTAFMNLVVLHLALFLTLGGDAVKTQTEVLPAVNFGGGIRFFATEWLSVKVEASNHFVISKRGFNVVDLQLALAVNLGELMNAWVSIALIALGAEPATADKADKAPAPANVPNVAERIFKGEERLDPAVHAPKLYTFITKSDPTHPMFGRAQLYLGQSLAKLGYTQAAAVWLARVATERSDPEALPEALQGLLDIFKGPHDEVLELSVLGTLDVASLPDKVASRVRYTQGLIDLKAGRDAWAKTQFGQLPAGSAEQGLARHAVLVTRVKRGESAAKLLPPFKELAIDSSVPAPVRLEAQLAVARLEYESKEFSGALEAYRAVKLPQLDPGRPALYLEEAWTKYRLGQHQAAMAVLVTLDAPSFDDAFLPDKYLLRAQIYMDKCHYLPARRAARQLLRRFAGTLDAIEARAPLAEQGVLSKAALAKGPAKQSQALWDLVQAERDQLATDGAGLGKPLNEHLRGVYGTAFAEATRLRDAKLEKSLENEANRLLDAAEQVRLVEYEVGLKLHARIGAHPDELVPESQDAMGPEDVSYNFSGEYWNDELRDIRIDLEDRCHEGGKT